MPSTLSSRSRASGAVAASAVKALAVVLEEEFNVPFSLYDAKTGNRLDIAGEPERVRDFSPEERALLCDLTREERPKVVGLEDDRYLIGFPLDGFGPSRLLAAGIIGAVGKSRPERALEQLRLGKWAQAVHNRLHADHDSLKRRRAQAEHDRQAMIAWEALMGLDRLNRGLRIHKEPLRHRRRILRVAGEVTSARSLAWVSLQGDADVVSGR